jgi:hypothetical protein
MAVNPPAGKPANVTIQRAAGRRLAGRFEGVHDGS